MVLALHIWGSAFEEASIDPECLAAAELLRHVLPPSDWVLVASNDAFVQPGRESQLCQCLPF